jgi:DNA gyrase inhibitor GyrI
VICKSAKQAECLLTDRTPDTSDALAISQDDPMQTFPASQEQPACIITGDARGLRAWD